MQLNYEISASDMVKGQRLFLRRKQPLIFWGLPVYGVCLGLFGLWMAFYDSLFSALPLVFAALYLGLAPALIMAFKARGIWNKTPVLHGPTTLTLAPDGFEISNPLSRATLRGQAIQSAIEDAHLWMLFLGPGSYYLVPKRAFATPAEAAQFERIMANFVALNAPKAPIAAP